MEPIFETLNVGEMDTCTVYSTNSRQENHCFSAETKDIQSTWGRD